MVAPPEISKALLDYLEGICPDKSPALTTPDRSIWFEAGKVDLIRHLRSVHADQSETAIQGT